MARQINFTYPKPVGLLEYLLSMIHGNDFLVVDFFAGSGTTAHAMMKLNQEDGGNRRFILVSSTEAVEEKIPPNPPFAKGGTDDANNSSSEKRGLETKKSEKILTSLLLFSPLCKKGAGGDFLIRTCAEMSVPSGCGASSMAMQIKRVKQWKG